MLLGPSLNTNTETWAAVLAAAIPRKIVLTATEKYLWEHSEPPGEISPCLLGVRAPRAPMVFVCSPAAHDDRQEAKHGTFHDFGERSSR